MLAVLGLRDKFRETVLGLGMSRESSGKGVDGWGEGMRLKDSRLLGFRAQGPNVLGLCT